MLAACDAGVLDLEGIPGTVRLNYALWWKVETFTRISL